MPSLQRRCGDDGQVGLCRKPLSPEPDGPSGGTRWLLLDPTAGLEPAASGLGNRRSVQLSYVGKSPRGERWGLVG